MEMVVTQSAGTAAQTVAPSGNVKGQAGENGAFQQVLVQQMNGGGAAAANTQTAPVMVVAAGEGNASADGLLQLSLEDLMAMIDGLIDGLLESGDAQQEAETDVSDEQLDQLQAALDQLSSLLALLGVPIQRVTQMQVDGASDSVQAAQAIPATEQAAQLRNQLQDQLLQLQTLLQQGNAKHTQQDPLTWLGKQVETLAATLAGEPKADQAKSAKAEGFAQQLFVAQSETASKDAGGLLQRLNSQAVHPLIWNGQAAADSAMAGQEQLQSPAGEVVTFTAGAHAFDSQRALTQLVANSAPAAATYVAADDFAQSMTGLIVQKFDVSTLNGLSEAKLMLFPEHLGQVDVKITMQNGLLTAVFQTDTAMAKDMLDNQMAQLRLALQSQGLNVDKLEVSQGQSASQLAGEHRGNGGQQQHTSRQASGSDNGSVDSVFEAEVVEQAAAHGLGFGRAINVKA